MKLEELLEDVNDAGSFLKFAAKLRGDRVSASSHGQDPEWENASAAQFLDGAIAWAEATDFGASQGLDSQNPWKQFAVFLYCGKTYE